MELRLPLILLLFVSSFPTFAQLSSLEEKKLRLKAVQLCYEYANLCANKDDDDREDFLLLFKSSEITILNDVLPANSTHSKIPLIAYSDEIHKHFSTNLYNTLFIEKISIAQINPNVYEIEIIGEKTISGREAKSNIKIADTLDIKIKMEYKKTVNSLKIIDVELLENPKYYVFFHLFSKGIFKKDEIKNDSFLFENQIVLTNEKGMIFQKIDDSDPRKNFTIHSLNSEIVQTKQISFQEIKSSIEKNENGGIIPVQIRISNIDFYPNFGFLPSIVSPIQFDDANSKNKGSNEIGFSLAFKLTEIQKLKIKLFTGLTWVNWSFTTNLGQQIHEYETLDPDGTSYLRKISILNYEANSKIRSLSIPFGFELTYPIHPKFEAIFRSNVSVQSNLNAKYTATASGNYSGYYDDLFQITLSENGVYDFGQFNLSQSNPIDLNRHLYFFSNGLGINRKINKKIGFTAIINHQRNINNLFINNHDKISSNPNELLYLNNSNRFAKSNLFTLNLGLKIKL